MASYSENKCDGVCAPAEDNKYDGTPNVSDAEYDKPVSLASIPAGTKSPYKGPGSTSLTIADPRMS